MHKISTLKQQEEIRYEHANVYALQMTAEKRRIKVAVKNGVQWIRNLIAKLDEPVGILYILHTPSQEGREGRYQSQLLEIAEADAMLERFEEYLETDSRHDIWFFAPQSKMMLVYDRHGLIYLYEASDCQRNEIERACEAVDEIEIPVPHVHHYHRKYDELERALLAAYEWRKSALLPEDIQ